MSDLRVRSYVIALEPNPSGTDMALIDCPECGRELSSVAETCPGCAYPIQRPPATADAARRPATGESKWWVTAASVVGRLSLGSVLMGVHSKEMAIIGGIVIAASAFPTWYRAKIDRLRASQSGAAPLSTLEARMAALEEHQHDRLKQIEQARSEQIVDLEERVEFAERLLTKRGQVGPS